MRSVIESLEERDIIAGGSIGEVEQGKVKLSNTVKVRPHHQLEPHKTSEASILFQISPTLKDRKLLVPCSSLVDSQSGMATNPPLNLPSSPSESKPLRAEAKPFAPKSSPSPSLIADVSPARFGPASKFGKFCPNELFIT